jgi:nucleoid DNA-binding protein
MPAKKKAVASKAAPAKEATKKAAPKAETKAAKASKASKAPKAAATAKKIKVFKEPMTKTAILAQIAEDTGLAKKEVGKVLDSLAEVIEGHLKKGGAGQCSIPGLMKIKTVRKPATKQRKGINPFTGEETIFKAKPARTVVKVMALKKLKDMAG